MVIPQMEELHGHYGVAMLDYRWSKTKVNQMKNEDRDLDVLESKRY